MFGLNDNNNKPADGGGSMPSDNSSSPPANPFEDTSSTPTSPPAAPAAVSTDNSNPVTDSPSSARPSPTSGSSELLDLKGQALTSLQPLVGHLDQSPEEKFKTTMMLIQATDNPSLVKQAYEAANQITDEKAKAQALLDVINEINYFTQHEKDAVQKA